ncbi:flagellar export protein FliJ [bacterium]|nr:flagellar export protein FliJ [bacterium]
MKFTFRLEGIYKLRKEEEREAQYELGRLRQEEYGIMQVLESVAAEQQKWMDIYTAEAKKENAGNYIMMIEHYFKNLDEVKKRNLKFLADVQKRIDVALIKVQATYKARKQVEYLKDKQYEEFKTEMARKEQLAMSEMSTVQFINKVRNGEGYEEFLS